MYHEQRSRHWSGALPAHEMTIMIARIENGLRIAVEVPHGGAGARRDRRAAGRRGQPLRLPPSVRVDRRARLDPVPVARHAGRGHRAAAHAAHAADRRGRPLLGRARASMPRCWRSSVPALFLRCCCRSRSTTPPTNIYIETPALGLSQHRARRRDPGRRGADAGELRCCGSLRLPRRKPLLVVAAVLAVARGRAVARGARCSRRSATGTSPSSSSAAARPPACCWACRSASPSALATLAFLMCVTHRCRSPSSSRAWTRA